MKTNPEKQRVPTGFTLIEMVLVLAIIALLMGVALKGMTGFLDRGRKIRAQGDMEAIQAALINYQSDNLYLPTTEQGLSALTSKPSTQPVPRSWSKYMPKELVDPFGSPFQYRRPPQKNTDGDYDLFSMGKDGKADTEDDIGNWQL